MGGMSADSRGKRALGNRCYGTCDTQLFEKAAARQSVSRTEVLGFFRHFPSPVEKRPQRPNLLLFTAKVIFKVPLPPLQDQDAQYLPPIIERVVTCRLSSNKPASLPAPSRSHIDE
jgi:hypothetical protein